VQKDMGCYYVLEHHIPLAHRRLAVQANVLVAELLQKHAQDVQNDCSGGELLANDTHGMALTTAGTGLVSLSEHM
jgi:hypothetical protein